jgi:lipopolysaccharide transport system ATP-binding protein
MSDTAIRVESLSKQYWLGGLQQRYATLGEQIRKWFSPRQLLRSARTKRPPFWALKDVSFQVQAGEVVGVIGRNGAGKSTLLKVLSQITEPTTGEVDIHGRVGSLLEVGTGFHPELTGRENVYLNGAILGMRRSEIARKFDDIIAFSEVEKFIDTPVKHYSSGMYTRLAFAVAAHLEPEILIVDEVLAVGDAEFQKKCLGKMSDVARGGRTVLFVSHNMAAIRNLCTRVVLLSGGQVAFDGDTTAGVEAYSTGGHEEERVAPHVLYCAAANSATSPGTEMSLERVELYAADGTPRADARTWEHLRFRISYHVSVPVRNAHLCIDLTDSYGRRLLSLETRTHTGRDDLGLATGTIECSVPQLPLAPGNYALGVALFVPDQRVIWAGDRLATLMVHPADVFGRGHLPPSSHAAIITPHEWNVVAN